MTKLKGCWDAAQTLLAPIDAKMPPIFDELNALTSYWINHEVMRTVRASCTVSNFQDQRFLGVRNVLVSGVLGSVFILEDGRRYGNPHFPDLKISFEGVTRISGQTTKELIRFGLL
jgi:hypothetical protein